MFFKSIGFFLFFCSFVLYAQALVWPYGTIHCFGDSHCGHFFTKRKTWNEFISQKSTPTNRRDPESCFEKNVYRFHNLENSIDVPFAVHWMGARTMHRVGRDGMNIISYGLRPTDIALFAFGEVDVRMHVIKQVDLNKRDLDEVIQTLAEKYVHRIFENQLYFNIKCVVLSVIPACGILDPQTNPLFRRIEITRKLNQQLAIECNKRGILFIPLPDFLSNPDESFNFEYSRDWAHFYPPFNGLIKDHVISYLLNINLSAK